LIEASLIVVYSIKLVVERFNYTCNRNLINQNTLEYYK
jgi:hypothetical protein